jgi:alanyl-tRNA synthetase
MLCKVSLLKKQRGFNVMKSSDIRQTFLDFFEGKGHVKLASSSLVPTHDPTLLFTNAGMVQFKDTFLGVEQRPYNRACTIQKCLRVSGKHNDLESVGPSPRHHTFFEMLGNFSFGDYFKREAIRYAWELMTQVFRLPVERLWITVYIDDDEAVQLWQEVGVDRQRILRFGEKENFWTMGETGPCGPCSEIHYYQGSDINAQKAERINADDDDYMEIWNLVFVQYNRDEQGNVTPLSSPSVDTGMGLERLTSVLQGVKTNYETDLFQPIIQRLMELTGKDKDHYRGHYASYNTIADHSRAIAFLIADGICPGNGGRDYVLRRIIRRAAYVGKTLGFERPFLASIVDVVIDTMGEWHPDLCSKRKIIGEVTTAEEERFNRTLSTGLRYLEVVIDQMMKQEVTMLPGREAFKLHDTYGFPLDLTQKILAERGLDVNVAEYEEGRREQQERSRVAMQLKRSRR